MNKELTKGAKMTNEKDVLWDNFKTPDLSSDELMDNGLNQKCSNCKCWVSKRIQIRGLCPDCRNKDKERKFRVGDIKEIILKYCEGADTQEPGFHIDNLDEMAEDIHEFYTETKGVG